MRTTLRAILISILLLLSSPDRLWASGFFLSQIGGPDTAPTDPDPTAVFWNPAALGATDRLEIQVDYISILRYAHYDREVDYQWDTAGKQWQRVAGEMKSASLFNYIPLPFVGLSYNFSDWFAAGLAFYSPYGASSTWDDSDGPQRYHSIAGRNNFYFFSPAASVKLRDWLYLGLTLSYVRSLVESERRADFSDIVGGLPEDPSLLATMKLEGFAGASIAGQLGLFIDLNKIKLGFSYQLPIEINNEGKITLTPQSQKLKGVIGDQVSEADARMSFTLPDHFKLSLDYYLRHDLRLRAYVEWVNWSRFDAIRIDVHRRTISLIPATITDEQHFHDAFGLRTQVKYWLTHGFALFTGIGFDRNAIPDETLSPVFIDSDKLAAHLGADWLVSDFLRAKLGVNYIHYFENTVEGSARVPTADGVYGSEVVFLDLNLTYIKR